MGAPLHVRMFVPLWIVNATSLPVAAWVVPVQPPPQSSEHEAQAAQNLMDASESIRLKVLDTEMDDAALAGARWAPALVLIDSYLRGLMQVSRQAVQVCVLMMGLGASLTHVYDAGACRKERGMSWREACLWWHTPCSRWLRSGAVEDSRAMACA